MALEGHILGTPPQRGKRVSQKQLDEYDRCQRLIEEVQCDLVNGVLRSEILNKFSEAYFNKDKESGTDIPELIDED